MKEGQIDRTDRTMSEVIGRSVAMHPTLLAESLEEAGRIHRDYAERSYHAKARTVALEMAKGAGRMAWSLREHGKLPESLDESEQTIAFHEAGRLLLIAQATMAE